MNSKIQFKLYVALVLAIFAVSTASPLIRFAQQDVSSISIAAYRMGISTLIIFPFAFRNFRIEINRVNRRAIGLLFLAGLLLALHFASWISSLEFTTITSSVVLVTTTPLWVGIFSPILLKEKMKRTTWIGLAISMIGVAIVASGNPNSPEGVWLGFREMSNLNNKAIAMGNSLAILGALSAAGYLIIGRLIRPILSLSTYTFGVYGTASLFLFIAVWVSGNSITGFSTISYIWLIMLAFIPQILGHSTLNWSLKYLPASYVSIALLGEPFGTVILSFFLLGEKPGVIEIIGGLIILSGIYIATKNEKSGLVPNQDH